MSLLVHHVDAIEKAISKSDEVRESVDCRCSIVTRCHILRFQSYNNQTDKELIGASLSEPHTSREHGDFVYIYRYDRYRKRPHVPSNSTKKLFRFEISHSQMQHG